MDQKRIERLWREEKYNVMYHSQNHYNAIRQAMKEKSPYNEVEALIHEALLLEPTEGSMRNTCQHIWGYFKKRATVEEKSQYELLLRTNQFTPLLRLLYQLAENYEVTYYWKVAC